MNESIIRNMTKDDIENSLHLFDAEQMAFCVDRLIELYKEQESDLHEMNGLDSRICELEEEVSDLEDSNDSLTSSLNDLIEAVSEFTDNNGDIGDLEEALLEAKKSK
jgi:chromosome segregation ATPase